MTQRSATVHSIRGFSFSLSPGVKGVLWIVIASLVIMSPTLVWGIPSSRDLTNHFRFALPFYDSLRAGSFYPGWLAESNAGFGDASFRFYPPALYYLLALARTITGEWFAATMITATFLLILGGLGVFFWARELGYGQSAVWAGIFYTVAPYHLNQFFQSFMFAEFAGAAVLPFAFAFSERVCRERRSRDVGGLALAYALLILTHLPLAIIGSIALLVYTLLRLDAGHRWTTLGRLSISALLGLGASACYWTTLLFELNWIRADNIDPDPSVDYRQNFVLSTFSPDYLNVWWMNILLLATVAMFWPALALMWKSARTEAVMNQARDRGALKAMCVVVLLTIVMATPLSRPIWDLLRPLQQTQFPWRWLTLTSIVCPLILAAAIPFWRRLALGRKRAWAMIAVGTSVLALTFSASHIIREAYWITPSQFEQQLTEIPGSPGVSQWWPAWVREPVQSMSSQVEAGDRSVAIDSWAAERRIFRVGNGESTTVRVRTFFYPHWRASTQGKALAVSHDKDGAMLISLPTKQATITLEFREPARVRYATALTIVGWLLIAVLLSGTRILRLIGGRGAPLREG